MGCNLYTFVSRSSSLFADNLKNICFVLFSFRFFTMIDLFTVVLSLAIKEEIYFVLFYLEADMGIQQLGRISITF